MKCPYCGSSETKFVKSNNEERYEQWLCNLCEKFFSANHGYIQDEPEYIMECSMCGKETRHRACGMCVSCEQVWNS